MVGTFISFIQNRSKFILLIYFLLSTFVFFNVLLSYGGLNWLLTIIQIHLFKTLGLR